MGTDKSVAEHPIAVGVIVGSLRSGSISKQLANALMAVAPEPMACQVVRIDDLPLYDEDLDIEVAAEPPVAWARFRADVRACDAILFVTPEYNRSVPAPLKNAIDVGSAPHRANAFAGIPAGIVSASPGRMGAFGANHHLRQSLVFLDMPAMQQPELYLGGSHGIFDADGVLRDRTVAEMLVVFMDRFASWAARHRRDAA